MVEHGDAKRFRSKWPFDGAPRGPLLLAVPPAQTIRVKMPLAWVVFVPWHANRQTAHKELSEGHVITLGAQEDFEIDDVNIGRFRRVDGDRILFFEHNRSVRRHEFDERAPRHSINGFFQLKQMCEALLPLVLLPAIESVHAMKPREDAMLPW